MSRSVVLMLAIGGCAILAAGGAVTLAADAPESGWSDAAALSYVVTGGNSEASTVGFKNDLVWNAERRSFTLKASALRAKSSSGPRRAVRDSLTDTVDIVEPMIVLSAEAYSLGGKYSETISGRLSWTGGAGWERNRFTGIENRYSVSGGLGSVWYDRPDLRFRTDYSVTWTNQEDVDQVADADNSFLGLRLTVDLLRKVGKSATYTHATIVDENLDDTEDLRVDMTNDLAVTINSRFALKVGLQLLYDRQPAVLVLDVENPDPLNPNQTVLVELDDLDSIFTTSLVMNF